MASNSPSKSSRGAPILPAEPGTQVVLGFKGQEDRIKCAWVGQQEDECLVLRLPLGAGSLLQVAAGESVTVRYLSQGTVYGFHTQVLGRYNYGPLRFLFLAYPSRVETHNLRTGQRVPCFLPASLDLEPDSLEGVVVDLGPGGVRFLHRLHPQEEGPPLVVLGQSAVLRCRLLGVEVVQNITCQVRNINLDQTRLLLGMAFKDPDQALIDRINDYIEGVISVIQEVKTPTQS